MVYETNSPGANLSAASEARSAAAELAHKASRKVDQVRATAADSLDTAASAVDKGGERVASAAHGAAGAISSGAQCVRAHGARHMIDDLAQLVKNNPGPALLGAAALGFVLGRALSRG